MYKSSSRKAQAARRFRYAAYRCGRSGREEELVAMMMMEMLVASLD